MAKKGARKAMAYQKKTSARNRALIKTAYEHREKPSKVSPEQLKKLKKALDRGRSVPSGVKPLQSDSRQGDLYEKYREEMKNRKKPEKHLL